MMDIFIKNEWIDGKDDNRIPLRNGRNDDPVNITTHSKAVFKRFFID